MERRLQDEHYMCQTLGCPNSLEMRNRLLTKGEFDEGLICPICKQKAVDPFAATENRGYTCSDPHCKYNYHLKYSNPAKEGCGTTLINHHLEWVCPCGALMKKAGERSPEPVNIKQQVKEAAPAEIA